ncbi:hypothetical protein TGPRC2_277220 [Toxoplasma gondii TgCatPRC2]|uniref:RecA family profile 1 domain-containing protein n=1 Tax=Toxoplasma gondii TgCatPRC2 TaxID=1130821 RepID=A0A151H747_TOXGO|nr:hypothetical protein TGPRC2_277220 [Toxoplasma gondii TgCatPRC2]
MSKLAPDTEILLLVAAQRKVIVPPLVSVVSLSLQEMTSRASFLASPSPRSPSSSSPSLLSSTVSSSASPFISSSCSSHRCFPRSLKLASQLLPPLSPRSRIPFLLPSLDALLAGGCPVGAGLLQICGPPGVGKTSLCLQLAASLAADLSQAPPSPLRASQHPREPLLSSSSSASAPRVRGRRATPRGNEETGTEAKRRRQGSATSAGKSRREVVCVSEKSRCMRWRARDADQRRTLFLDSEGGARPERIRQIVASFKDVFRRGFLPCKQLRAADEVSPERKREAEKPRASPLLRNASQSVTSLRHAEGAREAESRRVASLGDLCIAEQARDEEEREREDEAIEEVMQRIEVARVFDHKELLAVLQHTLSVLTRENDALEEEGEKGLVFTAGDRGGDDENDEEGELDEGVCGRREEAGDLASESCEFQSVKRARPRETYGLVVVDSLSWIYHPAFFHSAAECTASLFQASSLLAVLSTRFHLAVVVTNQLTTAKTAFAAHDKDGFNATFPGGCSVPPQTFTPSLGSVWQQIPSYSIGLRWSSSLVDPCNISASSAATRNANSLGHCTGSLTSTRQAASTREVVVFKVPTLFNALGEATEETWKNGGDLQDVGNKEARGVRNGANRAAGFMPVAPIALSVSQGGVRECMNGVRNFS